MTDNEIIKELNLRIDNFSRETLDLINRQNAEIERLKLECYKLYPKGSAYSMQVEASDRLEHQIKSEAIKEFAERLKEEIRCEDDCGYHCYGCGYECKDYVIAVDNIVKEMTEVEE